MKIKDSITTNINQDGTLTVLNLENNIFYELNEVATIAFNNLEKNEDEILNIILDKYDVEREHLQKDIKEILLQFKTLFLEE